MKKGRTVTQEQIDDLINTAMVVADVAFDKCLIVTVQLENGFILTESSACVSPENFSATIGYGICMDRIKNKLWELEGYKLQCELSEE
ncbi:Gp49 family protein [Parasporobacterium paucivorans]|uniref:Phage protein (N4 Gp49/phage Sf6 gene 66) family protein n=1 Tax=Parasporobacterium paucivorans DSM 15970 TaxID=1122934 RepID=A0A1M6B3P4_9FIRM|nr:Gp49 family protein [Parasporobacterium paucivorans]SHI43287.1 Phage protein (N4 Gp49/phage Sf6 gene 66) family protein [Parasporobacterium paucivorans DSM 15970]